MAGVSVSGMQIRAMAIDATTSPPMATMDGISWKNSAPNSIAAAGSLDERIAALPTSMCWIPMVNSMYGSTATHMCRNRPADSIFTDHSPICEWRRRQRHKQNTVECDSKCLIATIHCDSGRNAVEGVKNRRQDSKEKAFPGEGQCAQYPRHFGYHVAAEDSQDTACDL